jgi:hypothetical protein
VGNYQKAVFASCALYPTEASDPAGLPCLLTLRFDLAGLLTRPSFVRLALSAPRVPATNPEHVLEFVDLRQQDGSAPLGNYVPPAKCILQLIHSLLSPPLTGCIRQTQCEGHTISQVIPADSTILMCTVVTCASVTFASQLSSSKPSISALILAEIAAQPSHESNFSSYISAHETHSLAYSGKKLFNA